MSFGIYDTETNCWIGNNDGPRTFDDKVLADIAAQIVACQLGHPVIRYRGQEYSPAPVRLRDVLEPRMTPEEALKRIEEGYV